MARIEATLDKLVLKQGSTTLTLDKASGNATLQQKLLLWRKKPVEFPLYVSSTRLTSAALLRTSWQISRSIVAA